jgi:beta-lactamase superfamily II metal-dependent hydrolase
MSDISCQLLILDVGHGNCSIVSSTHATVMIDCAPGITVLDILSRIGVNRIDTVFLSHADSDHIGGLINVLSHENLQVNNIYVNPDSSKDTNAWKQLRIAVRDARSRYSLSVNIGLTSEVFQDYGEYKIEVLAPSPEIAMAGPGGFDLENRKLTSNSMSAVIGVNNSDRRLAIFPGDIDYVGLTNMLESIDSLQADILVYPHHGGNPAGADTKEFTKLICEAVRPRLTIFSFARNRHYYPMPSIIDQINEILADSDVFCTQLSRNCSPEALGNSFDHLSAWPAAGYLDGSCCCGTIVIDVFDFTSSLMQIIAPHRRFVAANVPHPLCIHQRSI